MTAKESDESADKKPRATKADGAGNRRPGAGGTGPGGGVGGGGSRGTGSGGPGQPSGGQQGPGNQPGTSRRLWHLVVYVVIALGALDPFQQFVLGPASSASTTLQYSDFKADLAAGLIRTAVIGPSQITGTMVSSSSSTTTVDYQTNYTTGADTQLIAQLQAAKPPVHTPSRGRPARSGPS